MASRCDQCGAEEYMPYVCKFCKGKYCAAHRLPENHGCAGVVAHRDAMRAQGRVFSPAQQSPVTPRLSTSAKAGASMDRFWRLVDGKMSYVFLGVCIVVFIAQVTARITEFLVVNDEFLTRPWTILTSIFAHGGLNHLFLNALGIVFFGHTVERLIGTRRFTMLFLAAGAVGGVAQVVITQVLMDVSVGTLGASGAINGVSGALVILAPTLTVLVFFVVPAPLWALAIFWVLFDLFGAVQGGSAVAHFAHLAGLAVGILYGLHLKRQGLRVVRQPPPVPRRF